MFRAGDEIVHKDKLMYKNTYKIVYFCSESLVCCHVKGNYNSIYYFHINDIILVNKKDTKIISHIPDWF